MAHNHVYMIVSLVCNYGFAFFNFLQQLKLREYCIIVFITLYYALIQYGASLSIVNYLNDSWQ